MKLKRDEMLTDVREFWAELGRAFDFKKGHESSWEFTTGISVLKGIWASRQL